MRIKGYWCEPLAEFASFSRLTISLPSYMYKTCAVSSFYNAVRRLAHLESLAGRVLLHKRE